MRLRIIKNFRMKAVPTVEIQAGSEVQVAPEVGVEWVKQGYAIPYEEKTEKAVVTPAEKRTTRRK
jgi:hypothetical protein